MGWRRGRMYKETQPHTGCSCTSPGTHLMLLAGSQFYYILYLFIILTGSLTNPAATLAGMLDLGGGSTQITFYPYEKTTFTGAPAGYITNFQLFNRTFHLYSHSYLGLGLMSARLQIMGGTEGKPLGSGGVLVTPCITPGFVTEFIHAGITYKVKGQSDVKSLYQSCSDSVAKMLSGKVNRANEASTLNFYAFSYYFDRAEDSHLIGM
ncbi:hypothetical protein GDO81_008529 [Engystomops pustulosus]|uniref:Ectonucleoside triphosphate diphosphohydrolase 6 n=1 Tax=Engystomops pustulosus TaxID=76066 RepID=A0AAV7CH41_ENGPU|nr:hypothetical protein GDO81_008529 [Engystomops pustulosus]